MNDFVVSAICCDLDYLQCGLLLAIGSSMMGLLSVLTISYHCIVSTLHSLWVPNLTPPLRISGSDRKYMNLIQIHNKCFSFFIKKKLEGWADLSDWSEEAHWCLDL